jgi:hypothetical protein
VDRPATINYRGDVTGRRAAGWWDLSERLRRTFRNTRLIQLTIRYSYDSRALKLVKFVEEEL